MNTEGKKTFHNTVVRESIAVPSVCLLLNTLKGFVIIIAF